jgi:uncharacterized protein
MLQPDFERAKRYALDRLERELPSNLTYHRVAHTRDEVTPTAERLARLEGIAGEELVLLLTAAYYHDLGFVMQRAGHEAISAQIAAEVLPGFGYSPEHIQVIRGIIMVTQLPQTPHTRLEEILADADLEVFGRQDFWPRNQDLRSELETFGLVFTDAQWYSNQLAFMQAHRYFTAAARAVCDAQKQQNITEMIERLAHCPAADTAQTEPSERSFVLSTHEKIAMLRSVSLFAETPDDVLADVANLLQPLEVSAGETIVHKGECGDCMYIIAQGRVRVHEGELLLNYLGTADVFGEMALLDDAPRVASVTATETTRLFRLDQESFYSLMANRAEIGRGVIRVLCQHLRGRVRDMAHDFEYMQQMARISAAAAALEAGRYDSRSLDEVGQRGDELGQLARVFQRMADEVQAREERLKLEVQQLRIQIDEVKKAREVAEITESEYFQRLQQKARDIRKGQAAEP